MKNFKELKIWKKGMKIVRDVYMLSNKLPEEEKYGLKSQITRAAVSIPSNIAEGSSRESDLDNRRFQQIALGSAFELETQLLIIAELNLVSPQSISKVIAEIHEEQKMISSFISTLKAKS